MAEGKTTPLAVLVVAPGAQGLQNQLESLSIARTGVTLTLLDGLVTQDNLRVYLRNAAYDVVHFALHGQTEGLMLSDGPLPTTQLVALLQQQKNLRWVAINACYSLAVASDLHNALNVPLVAHPVELSDPAAVEFTAALYLNFTLTDNLEKALDTANTAMRLRFPDVPRAKLLNRMTTEIGKLLVIVESLQEQLGMQGNLLNEVRQRIETVEMRQIQTLWTNRRLLVMVGGMLVLILLALTNLALVWRLMSALP